MARDYDKYIKWICGRNGEEAHKQFSEFASILKVQNLSARTVFNYLAILERFLKWCKPQGLGIPDWNRKLAYKWASTLDNPHSRSHYILSVKRYFQVMGHPDAEMKVPRRPKAKLPDVLSEDVVLKLADACDSIRDRALILVCYEAAKRNHEIRGVKVKDVHFDSYGATVLFRSTKSNDSNVRLILSAKALQAWMEIHGDRDNPEAFVFYGRDGAVSEERFREILREAAVKAGIERRVWPHLLRHSRIAVLKRQNRLTDADIMNITGHTDRRQLDRYGKITMTMTNQKLLQIQGLQEKEEKERVKVQKCRRCGFVNGPLSQYCGRCTLPLDENVVYRRDRLLADVELLTHIPGGEELFKDIVERAKDRVGKLLRERKDREVKVGRE